jgi:hypothetical protein
MFSGRRESWHFGSSFLNLPQKFDLLVNLQHEEGFFRVIDIFSSSRILTANGAKVSGEFNYTKSET